MRSTAPAARQKRWRSGWLSCSQGEPGDARGGRRDTPRLETLPRVEGVKLLVVALRHLRTIGQRLIDRRAESLLHEAVEVPRGFPDIHYLQPLVDLGRAMHEQSAR